MSPEMAPSRHIAPPRHLGREQSTAGVDGQPSIAEDDARDPELTRRLLPHSPARLDRAWAKGKVDARCRACKVSFVLWVGAAALGPGRVRRRRRSSPMTRRTP